jgi:hypothetical protein
VDRHDGVVGQAQNQEPGHVVDEGLMAAADRRHLDDLALDQLDAVAAAEDADLGHAVILRSREASSRTPPPRPPWCTSRPPVYSCP